MKSIRGLLTDSSGNARTYHEANAKDLLLSLFGADYIKMDLHTILFGKRKKPIKIGEDNTALISGIKILIPADERQMLFGSLIRFGYLANAGYIYINEYPENLTMVQRYKMLHEFGHGTLKNGLILERRKLLVINVVLILVFAFLGQSGFWPLVTVFLASLVYVMANWQHPNLEAEANADLWALNHVPIQDRPIVLQKLISAYSNILKYLSDDIIDSNAVAQPKPGKKRIELMAGYQNRVKFFRDFLDDKELLNTETFSTHIAFINYSHFLLIVAMLIAAYNLQVGSNLICLYPIILGGVGMIVFLKILKEFRGVKAGRIEGELVGGILKD